MLTTHSLDECEALCNQVTLPLPVPLLLLLTLTQLLTLTLTLSLTPIGAPKPGGGDGWWETQMYGKYPTLEESLWQGIHRRIKN